MLAVGRGRTGRNFCCAENFFAIFLHNRNFRRDRLSRKKKSDRRKQGAGVLVHTVFIIPTTSAYFFSRYCKGVTKVRRCYRNNTYNNFQYCNISAFSFSHHVFYPSPDIKTSDSSIQWNVFANRVSPILVPPLDGVRPSSRRWPRPHS